MERIIWHWSAGRHKASVTDKKHYHRIIEGDGTVVDGNFNPLDNLSTKTPYAAHTRGANTGSIGLAVAAMMGAKERPFSAGQYPITQKQLEALVSETADLCKTYDIAVTRQTILSHAEVQPTLGVKQRGKWDFMWIPGMTGPMDAVLVGDRLRTMVRVKLGQGKGKPKPNLFTAILSIFKAFGRKRK